MSTSLTERITRALGDTATAIEIEATYSELNTRENEIRARITQIEAEWPGGQVSNTPEQQRAITLEHESLLAELRQLSAQLEMLLESKAQAERRESPALAASLLKSLPAKLQKAEALKAEWLAARGDLTEHAGLLAHHRMQARPASTKKLDEATFERLCAVLEWLPPGETLSPSNLPHRAIMTRLANQRGVHLDESGDVAMARAWRSAGVVSATLFGIYPEADAEPHAPTRPRQPSGYLDEPRVPDAA